MTLATSQILAPKTIEKAISQLELPGTSLQTLFGWGIGGTNVARQGGRNFAYDVFNVTRRVATGRTPAQALARRQAAGGPHRERDFSARSRKNRAARRR